jgi:hypothetical protein
MPITEMIRTCPKCGDYYADEPAGFCLADGMPLVSVEPNTESWSEGARVIEEKAQALSKQRRKMSLRRVLMTATTMLIVIMVVCVVAVNGFLYLQPEQEEVVSTEPSTQPPPLVDSITPGTQSTPTRAPSPRPTVKPNGVPVKRETTTPKPDTKASPTPTPASPTPSPRPSPSPRTILSSIPIPTPVAAPVCSDADKSLERRLIIDRYGERWRRMIEGERRKIIAENVPAGVENAEAGLGAVEYEAAFSKACAVSSVTARYAWRVRTNFNGTTKVVTVAKQKRFACVKAAGNWLCS